MAVSAVATADSNRLPKMPSVAEFIGKAFDIERLRRHVDGRLQGLRVDRYSWWTHWREIADYLLPRRYRWLVTANQMNRGSPMNQRIIDSTAGIAWRTCAAGMQAGITSPARPWFRMTLEDDDLAEDSEIRLWLDECSRRILHVMAKSNYYQSKHTQYGDLISFGTAPMIIYDDFDDVIRCFTPCAGEYYCAVNDRLEVDTLYREFNYTIKQVVEKWGIQNVSEGVKQSYESGNGAGWSREIIVCHAMEPNRHRVIGAPGIRGMAYVEIYWEYGSSKDKCLEVRGFHERPFSVPRWDQSGNDAYGRSPAMDALGDIKQLQVEQKRKSQGIDKMVNPPLKGPVSLKNEPVSSLPGGITYVPTGDEKGLSSIYDIKIDLNHMVADIKEVQSRIDRTFFKDLWLMIGQLDTVRTATEIAARKEEKMIQLGPVLERFHNESLDPDIDRIFAIMWRAKLLPKAPESLKGRMIKVEYTSVLAQAQRAVMTTGIERLVGFVGSIAAGQEGKGQHPDILDNLDWDKIVDKYAGMLGVDASVIVPYAKVVKMRNARAQKQAQMEAAQNAMAAVQGAKTMSETQTGAGQNALQQMIS